MAQRIPWSRDELLVAFRLYCRTPFGKLHRHNPEIIELAHLLGRTPSAVGMKACNFASLDPSQQARSIKALGNVSRGDRELWQDFEKNPEAVATAAEAAYVRVTNRDTTSLESELDWPDGPSEVTREVRTRSVQGFFRAAVLSSYEFRCALSDIAVPDLINASHIIPWKTNVSRRADPRNGIALNALYDRAFDRGLICFDDRLRVVLSPILRNGKMPQSQKAAFIDIEGHSLRQPSRFAPDPAAIAYHRNHIFRVSA